ncbi:MAG: discoidin domain-containing protein [Bifidobacteriaceae bacterium]|jgi:hypothetical protein|nr:discoidin domain-containing protein [Bifidobacteriaceae bacterium]
MFANQGPASGARWNETEARRLARRAVALAAVATLSCGVVALGAPADAAQADAAPADAAPPAVTTADLADSSSGQQRWQSIPGSRIVLNPSGAGHANDMPLAVGYFAKDGTSTINPALKTYRTSRTAPASQPSARSVAWSTAFESAAGWTPTFGMSVTAADGIVQAKLDGTAATGAISRVIAGVDLALYHHLSVDVAALSSADTGWSAAVAVGGREFELMAGALAATGVSDFDLREASPVDAGGPFPVSGVADLTVTLRTVDQVAESGAVSYRSLQLHDAVPQPWEGFTVGAVEEFENATGWSAGSNITFRSDGAQGAVLLGDTSYSFVSKSFTVDLDATPLLSLTIAETTGLWALKVNDTTNPDNDKELRHDSSATGVITFDLKAVTGWSGTKTFRVVLYQINANTRTVFDQFVFHGGDSGEWLSGATSRVNTWRPDSLEATGTYADGQITIRDVFHDENSFSRSFVSTLTTGGVAIMGPNSAATWDADSRTLTTSDSRYVMAYAVPDSVPDPFVNGANWHISFPAGVAEGVVGVGMAVNSTAVEADPLAAAKVYAAAALADPGADLAAQTVFWNDYLAKVPVPADFSIQTVATGGVTAAQAEHTYYRAMVDVEMDVLPATPETGNAYPILATGKPSLWASGAPGARFAAQWDSLVGQQVLVHTDPDNAWATFQGLMAGVTTTGVDPAEGGDLGILHGESLPSRKAQTAWILYSATADQDKLESVYPNLKLHLNWERHNLRWIFGSNNYPGELDCEFVSSLAYDLRFAIKIATLLGLDQDAAHWTAMIAELTAIYETYFFPDTPDASGAVHHAIQSSFPTQNNSRGTSWYDEGTGRWVGAGDPLYNHPAFVLDQLAGEKMARVMAKFLSKYNPNDQLAGLGLVKGPDVQLAAYGLLDMDPTQLADTSQAKTEAELRNYADVVINSIIRDTNKAGEFAEVLEDRGAIGDAVTASGVMPSLFSLANYVDFVWMANGFRLESGGETYVHLAGRQGGVTGLSYMGGGLDVEIDGNSITVSGDEVATTVLAAPVGATANLFAEQTPVAVEDVTVSGPAQVTRKGQTARFSAEVLPADATWKSVAWSVVNTDGSATDKATIDVSGVLTPVKNGQVVVRATAVDGSEVRGEAVVAISGQTLTPISVGKPVTVSHTIDQPKDRINDGLTTTRWNGKTGSGGDSHPWVYIDLLSPADLSSITVEWEAAYAKSFRIQWSNDAVTWNDIQVFQNQSLFGHAVSEVGQDALDALREAAPDGVRHVRLYTEAMYNSEWGISIWEFTIDGAYRIAQAVESLDVAGQGGATEITRPGRALQMVATAQPANATDQRVEWYVYGEDGEETELAEIDALGKLAPAADGVVEVVARAVDGSGAEGSRLVTISGQERPNLALDQATSASQVGDGGTPNKATDGSQTTRWATGSMGVSDRAWLEVDLGAVMTIATVTLSWEAAAAPSFDLQVRESSNDAWTTIASGAGVAGGLQDLDFDPVAARHVRLANMPRSSYGGVSIWEFEIYGPPAGPAPLELSTVTGVKCVAGKAYLTVTAYNNSDVAASLTVTTPYGVKVFPSVAPGKAGFHSFTTRLASYSGVAVSVTGEGVAEPARTGVALVVHATASCG